MKTIKTIVPAILIGIVFLVQSGSAKAQMSEYKFNQLFDQAFQLTISEKYEQAFPIWSRLVKADNKHGQALYFYALSRFKALGSYATTEAMLRGAVNRADYYNQTGRAEDKTAPVKAWFYLGEAYAESAQYKGAIEAYRNYMSCIPMASLDHKREVIAKINEMKEQLHLTQTYGNTSLIASQKP